MVNIIIKEMKLEISIGDVTITCPDHEITENDYEDLKIFVELFLSRIKRKMKINTNPNKLSIKELKPKGSPPSRS